MQVQLIVANKSQRGRVIPVDIPEFRIGRTEYCHFRSESSWVSPQHCVIQSHNGTVTILDSSGKKGTFVNGGRISSSQELKDGDKIRVGEHSFVVSITADTEQSATNVMPSDTELEQEPESVFAIQRNQRSIPITKSQLFALARKGDILPDTVITVDGTKVFADSISGIVFDNELSAVTSPPISETQKSEPFEYYQLEKKRDGIPFAVAPLQPRHQSHRKSYGRKGNEVDGSNPFDIADEPHVQVAWVPSARRGLASSDLREPLENSLSQITAWVNSVANRHVAIAGSVLVALCLLGVLAYFLIDEQSSYGAVRISGTLTTTEGMAIAGANVTLHPRCENGQRATGITNRWGRITVTTGTDSDGRGAVPGEYDVTFAMRPAIPRDYECPTTSGLDPIRVEPTGGNRFNFALSSAGLP
jgi:pSer/pThr/pTyr-binding forkhead associated (FHA) protein